MLGPTPCRLIQGSLDLAKVVHVCGGCISGEKIFIFDKWVCAPQNSLQIFFQIEKTELSPKVFLNRENDIQISKLMCATYSGLKLSLLSTRRHPYPVLQ